MIFLFKENKLNTFNQQGCIKLISNNNIKDISDVTKQFYFIII